MSDDTDYTLYPEHHAEERVRYFSGQFLGVQDFVDEQRYILDRLRRALNGITSAGVASGMAVSSPGTGKLTIGAGTAIDTNGRQLVLGQARQNIPVPDAHKGKTIDVRVHYREVDARPQGENGQATRIHESPGVELVVAGQPPVEKTGVTLARVKVQQDGVCVLLDATGIRKYAGIAFPTSSPERPVIRSGAPARPHTLDVESALSVAGKLGVGTLAPETALDVRGMAKFDHLHVRHKEFKLGGETSKFYPVVFEDVGWGSGALVLEISRADQNLDAEGAGSLMARFTCHASSGHGSEFIQTELHQSGRFIARVQHAANSRYFVAWLRGARTYRWRANHEAKLANHQAKQKKVAGKTFTVLTKVDASLNRDHLLATSPIYQPVVYGPLTVEGNIEYTGQLSKLDTQEQQFASIRCQELRLGHSTQRGSPGKALVDQKAALVVNPGAEWAQTRLEGNYVHVNTRLQIHSGDINTGIADSAQATVVAEQNHLHLVRTGGQQGGRKLFLELRQEDTNKRKVPEVRTSIRFHHMHRYWHRIEASSAGFSIRTGDLSSDDFAPLATGNLQVSGNATVSGKATVSGALSVSGDTTFSGNVSVSSDLSVQGTVAGSRLELTRASEHMRLSRANSLRTGGRVMFLELVQDDTNKKNVPETNPSIRFTHAHRYSHRIEARSDGFYFLSGDLSQASQWRTLYTGNLSVNGSLSTTDHASSTIRCYDFKIGHKNRRGSPGRALVDIKDGETTQLHVNYSGDWSQLHLGGSVYAPKNTYIGGKPAVAGLSETGLRIVRGTVSASGTIVAGSGFTIGKEGNKWKISFSPRFGSTPTVIATQQYPDENTSKDGGNTRDNAIVVAVNRSWAYVKTGKDNGDHRWRRFHFIAIST